MKLCLNDQLLQMEIFHVDTTDSMSQEKIRIYKHLPVVLKQ